MAGLLLQLNISPGGMPKRAIERALVTAEGVAGDWQTNRKYHGGPARAVCLFSHELYAWLRADHDIDLPYGTVGENFTTQGIDLDALHPGDRLHVGACVIEITKVRQPCRNLNRWHPQLMSIITGRSGWLAKVVTPGQVQPNDPIQRFDPAAPAREDGPR